MRKKSFKGKYFLYSLPNGLKAAFFPLRGVRAVAIELWLKLGGWYEKKVINGTFHFLEHLLSHGTVNYPSFKALSLREEELGISTYHAVGGSSTMFNWRVPRETFSESLQLLSEIVFFPSLPMEAVDRERKIILQEYKDWRDSPYTRFFVNLEKKYLGNNHPYTIDSLGTPDTLEKIDHHYILETHQKYYRPERMVLVVVGDLRAGDVEKTIKKYFSQPRGVAKLKINSKLPKFSRKVVYQEEKVDQVSFKCFFPLLNLRGDDFKRIYSVVMISHLLGGSKRSRLSTLLREKEPLAYSIGTTSASYPEGLVFGFVFSSSLQNVDRILDITRREIEKIKKDGFTKEEFLSAQRYGIYQISMSNDTIWSIAENIISDLFWRNKIYTPEEKIDAVRSITKEDLIDVSGKIFDFEKTTVGFLGNKGNIGVLRKNGIDKLF